MGPGELLLVLMSVAAGIVPPALVVYVLVSAVRASGKSYDRTRVFVDVGSALQREGWRAEGVRKLVHEGGGLELASESVEGDEWSMTLQTEDIPLSGLTVRASAEGGQGTGAPAFDAVVASDPTFEQLRFLHHGFREAWMRIREHGRPELGPSGLSVRFDLDAPDLSRIAAIRMALERGAESLRSAPSLPEMALSDPVPMVRRRAFDQLSSPVVDAEFLQRLLDDEDVGMRLRAKVALDEVEEDAIVEGEPADVALVLSRPGATPAHACTALRVLLRPLSDSSLAGAIRIAEHHRDRSVVEVVWAVVSEGALSENAQQLLANLLPGLAPVEALLWLVLRAPELHANARRALWGQVQEEGTTSLVEALRAVQPELGAHDRDRVDQVVAALQARARGDRGGVSLAQSAGGGLAVAPGASGRRTPGETER